MSCDRTGKRRVARAPRQLDAERLHLFDRTALFLLFLILEIETTRMLDKGIARH